MTVVLLQVLEIIRLSGWCVRKQPLVPNKQINVALHAV